MNFLYSFILVISLLHSNAAPAFENYFTLHGQVIYPGRSQISIPSDSELIIELQDISISYDVATTIAKLISNATVFPITFNMNYTSNQIMYEHLHVLNAKIINKYDDILFVNEKRIEVKLFGANRTKFIDVPVVLSKLDKPALLPIIESRKWPDLIGMDGNKAVDIIKQETGYENVFIVNDKTGMTKDLLYDRVCVEVDKDGKVARVPRVG